MASIGSNEWITTFIYRQDLRSYYMNSLLYSIVKPGVYNQGISLLTDKDTGTSSIKIGIRKGTTFIFSNDYVYNSKNASYERSFNNQGINTENDNVLLIKSTAFRDLNFEMDISPADTTEKLYVIAWLNYDPNSDETGSGSGAYFPSFGVFAKNTTRTSINSESYFTRVAGNLSEIPDGKLELSTSNKKVFYVIIGILDSCRNNTKSESFNAFNEEWFKNHIFTNKGLPDYNYSLTSMKNIPNPSLMVNFSGSEPSTKLYVDWEDISINGDIYESRIDWKDAYGLTDTVINNNYVDFKLLEDEIAGITKDSIIYDFVFAKVTSFSNSDDLTLDIVSNIKNNGDCLDFIDYRYIEEKTLSTEATDTCSETDFKHYKSNGSSIEYSFYILPLDEESLIHERSDLNTNTYRLWKYIKNKGLLHKVMNNIRKEKIVEGTNALIPVAIAFRYIKADKTTLDGFTSVNSINPMNIINLLNLTADNVNYNIISNSVDNVYSVLPVIE